MDLHLKIIGAILIALACIHIVFPKQFKWKTELAGISLLNQQLMYVHTFFVALVVLLMGILCLYAAHDIVHTRLGRQVAFGLFIFWVLRLIFQFFVYSSQLWRGKRFETGMHVLFSFFWAYFSTVFLMVALVD